MRYSPEEVSDIAVLLYHCCCTLVSNIRIRLLHSQAHWKKQHPEGWHRKPAHSPTSVKSDGQEVQRAAAEGDVKTLEEELSKGKKDDVVNKRDENGWQPAHEAARGGHKETLELLVKNGADVNARTFGGDGETPLHIAKTRLGPFHPVVEYLQSLGALDVGSSQRSEL
jgi:ankyrin repeat protein